MRWRTQHGANALSGRMTWARRPAGQARAGLGGACWERVGSLLRHVTAGAPDAVFLRSRPGCRCSRRGPQCRFKQSCKARGRRCSSNAKIVLRVGSAPGRTSMPSRLKDSAVLPTWMPRAPAAPLPSTPFASDGATTPATCGGDGRRQGIGAI
jgi:hypothetical protein